MAKEGDYAQVKLPSGEVRKVHLRCYATIGQVGNSDHDEPARQGGPQALEGSASAQPWRDDESGRPSDGWR